MSINILTLEWLFKNVIKSVILLFKYLLYYCYNNILKICIRKDGLMFSDNIDNDIWITIVFVSLKKMLDNIILKAKHLNLWPIVIMWPIQETQKTLKYTTTKVFLSSLLNVWSNIFKQNYSWYSFEQAVYRLTSGPYFFYFYQLFFY